MDNSLKKPSLFFSPNSVFLILLLTCFSFFWSACNGKKEEAVDIPNADSLARMTTRCVTSLISDSGVIRYKIITDEWRVYDNAKEPYWYFPLGLYVEQFDLMLNPDAHVRCDTAYFYERQKLWHLIGKVHMENLQQEKFDTEELFWDQNKEKIYSDKYIQIEQKDRIITGIGFDSNQSMTKYVIRKPQGIFPVENDINVVDSSGNDSISSPPPQKNDSITTNSKEE